MSQLDLGTQQLELERYPQQEESTQLQAWEAADEYLLQQLENVDIGGRPVLIFNDNFGTTACALHAHRPYSVSDSYMSQLATRHNLKLNGLDPEQVTLLDSGRAAGGAGGGVDSRTESAGAAGTAAARAAPRCDRRHADRRRRQSARRAYLDDAAV